MYLDHVRLTVEIVSCRALVPVAVLDPACYSLVTSLTAHHAALEVLVRTAHVLLQILVSYTELKPFLSLQDYSMRCEL
jgi:hypothetical protein